MAEWSNAAVLKTVVLYPRDRGFESLFLRRVKYPAEGGVNYFVEALKKAGFLKRLKTK